MIEIRIATSDEQILACFPIMKLLRPGLAEEHFLGIIRLQEKSGFKLVSLQSDETTRAVAGYRIIDNLAGGRVLYVDDLVTDDAVRSQGFGGSLFDWLAQHAESEHCHFLELDSGVHRFDAHRFYLMKRMHISSHHFRLPLR